MARAGLLAAVTFTIRAPLVESSAPDISAVVDSLRPIIDRALLTGRLVDFDDAIGFVDRHLSVTPGEPVLLHYRGFALFRKASILTSIILAALEPVCVLVRILAFRNSAKPR